MPKDAKGFRARKAVAALFRQYLAALLKQFTSSPEELMKRAEQRAAEAPPDQPHSDSAAEMNR